MTYRRTRCPGTSPAWLAGPGRSAQPAVAPAPVAGSDPRLDRRRAPPGGRLRRSRSRRSSGGATRSCRPTSPTAGRTPSTSSALPEDGTAAGDRGERSWTSPAASRPGRSTTADLGQEKARDLFLAGARAYAELTDAEQRNTLLFRRKTLREERAKRPAAASRIKTDLLDSEAQYKKGQALMDAGKHREALMLLEFAADCDPQNGLYAAELAYCRFLLTPASPAGPSRSSTRRCAATPSCGLAAFYAGEIERQARQPPRRPRRTCAGRSS